MNKAAKFWIGVACKEHVENGVKLGICQFCHGKSAPDKRLSRGDFVIYYLHQSKSALASHCLRLRGLLGFGYTV